MEKIPELRTKAKRLRQLLRQVESVPGVGNVAERDRDAHRKRNSRAAAKTFIVPACEDRVRRERLKADDEGWLRYYFTGSRQHVLSNTKKKCGKVGKRGRKPGRLALPVDNIQQLIQVKKFVDQMGGIDAAKSAVNVLAQILG